MNNILFYSILIIASTNLILTLIILIKLFYSNQESQQSQNNNGYEYLINKIKKEKNRLIDKLKDVSNQLELYKSPETKRNNIRINLNQIDEEIICSTSKIYELICYISKYFTNIRTNSNKKLPIELETIYKEIYNKIKDEIL